MREDQLLCAMQKPRSYSNGAASAKANVLVKYNNAIGLTTPTITPTPGARRMALELGLDLSRIKGTGEAGIILHRDVLNYVATGRSTQSQVAVGAFREATAEAQLVTPRGRQRTPEPWLMAVLCRLGVHGGPWAYVADGNCSEARECRRCGSVHARTRHQLDWRYRRELTCNQVRICTRCNAIDDERTRHEIWSEAWDAGRESEAHKCLRCGKVETWSTASDGD